MRADNPFLMNITHDQLVDYIEENTLTVLGEEIHLYVGAIQGTWDALFPDLMGTDAQGRTVIIKVQTDLDDDSTGIPPTIHKFLRNRGINLRHVSIHQDFFIADR